MKNILQARDRFHEAAEAYEAATAKMADLEIDIKIAHRQNQSAAEIEKQRDSYRTEVWYPAFKERQVAVHALCAELNIAASDLKGAL
jgi:hypothetical protein